MVRRTDRPAMTIAVDMEGKAIKQTNLNLAVRKLVSRVFSSPESKVPVRYYYAMVHVNVFKAVYL